MSTIETTGGAERARSSTFSADLRSLGQERSLRNEGKVLPEQARRHNRALVLRTLFHDGEMSRADLSRETGLTRVTISDLVGSLIEDSYVVELGVRPANGPGKPAILVDLNRAGHNIVALDLSQAEGLSGALLRLDGTIIHRFDVPRPVKPGNVVQAVIGVARDLVIESVVPILGVGVGTPGVVDDRGVVLSAPTVGWYNFDLRGQLETALRLPVIVGNDANAAVLAEYTFGSAGEDVMLVKVDRGVGAGLLSGGLPLRGGRSAAGEIGHVTVGTDGGPECVCGKMGCLEAWASVPALTARLATTDPSRANEVLASAGERLGIALAPIVGALDLSEIVLAGPEDLLSGAFIEATADTVRARTLPEFHDAARVRMSAHGSDVVLKGAAVKVLAGQLGVT